MVMCVVLLIETCGKGPYWPRTLPWKSRLTFILWVPFDALPRHTPESSFFRSDTFEKPSASIRDFAWDSVKLLAPATGAPGGGGLFGALTADVLPFWLAGGLVCDCANAGRAKIIRAVAIIILRMAFPTVT